MRTELHTQGWRLRATVTDCFASEAAADFARWLRHVCGCDVKEDFNTMQVGCTCGWLHFGVTKKIVVSLNQAMPLHAVDTAACIDEVGDIMECARAVNNMDKEIPTSYYACDSELHELVRHAKLDHQVKVCAYDQAQVYVATRLANIGTIHGAPPDGEEWHDEAAHGMNLSAMLDNIHCSNKTNHPSREVRPAGAVTPQAFVHQPLAMVVNTQATHEPGAGVLKHWFSVVMHLEPA